jgi:hypothetical protein
MGRIHGIYCSVETMVGNTGKKPWKDTPRTRANPPTQRPPDHAAAHVRGSSSALVQLARHAGATRLSMHAMHLPLATSQPLPQTVPVREWTPCRTPLALSTV